MCPKSGYFYQQRDFEGRRQTTSSKSNSSMSSNQQFSKHINFKRQHFLWNSGRAPNGPNIRWLMMVDHQFLKKQWPGSGVCRCASHFKPTFTDFMETSSPEVMELALAACLPLYVVPWLASVQLKKTVFLAFSIMGRYPKSSVVFKLSGLCSCNFGSF